MKKTFLVLMLAGALLPYSALAKNTSVRSYVKPSKGQIVQPHIRTAPDKNYINNYSSQGNTNPYTGKQGTVTFEQYQKNKANTPLK